MKRAPKSAATALLVLAGALCGREKRRTLERRAEALRALASEMGYELYSERPSGKQAVSDDDLSDVAGGRNILSGNNSGVLYPYSWFVTILRLLSKSDEGDSDPNASDTYPTPTPDPSKR